MMRLLFFASIFLVVACSRQRREADMRHPTMQAATYATALFHEQFSTLHHNEICKSLDSHALDSVTHLPCANFLENAHSQLGNVLDATSEGPPVANNGLVTMDYNTHYHNGESHEHFE